MRAWTISQFGGPLNLIKKPCPPIKNSNEILIKIYASSLNPLDVLMQNAYGTKIISSLDTVKRIFNGFYQKRFPLTLGRDFVGKVIENGPKVSYIKEGDQVWGTINVSNPCGAQAEYTVIPETHLYHVPKNIDIIEAAALPYTAMTVMSSIIFPYLLKYPSLLFCNSITNLSLQISRFGGSIDTKSLERENLFPSDNLPYVNDEFHEDKSKYMEKLDQIFEECFKGKDILIRGGSGGISTFAIQLFEAYGARNIVSLCSPSSFSLIVSLGATHTIDYKAANIQDQLKSIGLFDLIYDTIGDGQNKSQNNILDLMNLLKPYNSAKYICMASPLLKNTDKYGIFPLGLGASALDFYKKALKALSKGNFFYYGYYMPNRNFMEKLTQLVEQGRIKPVIDKIWDFDETPQAYEYLSNPSLSKKGKIIIKM